MWTLPVPVTPQGLALSAGRWMVNTNQHALNGYAQETKLALQGVNVFLLPEAQDSKA